MVCATTIESSGAGRGNSVASGPQHPTVYPGFRGVDSQQPDAEAAADIVVDVHRVAIDDLQHHCGRADRVGALLADLVGRGLDFDDGLLVVIDGAKALSARCRGRGG